MKHLKGGVAVVTGAASGIGRALAERFAAEGMNLVLADLNAAQLEEVAAAIQQASAKVLVVPTDLARLEQVEALARRTLAEYGAIHLLCNNAGVLCCMVWRHKWQGC